MYFYEYESLYDDDEFFDLKKESLREKVVEAFSAMIQKGQNIYHIANLTCRAFLDEDEDAEKFFYQNSLDHFNALAWLDMDTKLYQKLLDKRCSQ